MRLMIDWEHWIFEVLAVAHALFVLALMAYIITRQKNYSVAIAWIAILALMPFLGVVLYWIFGRVYVSERYQKRAKTAQKLLGELTDSANISLSSDDNMDSLPPKWQALANMGERQTDFGVQGGHRATLLAGADSIFSAIISDINKAQKSVLLEFYIVHPEGQVQDVLEALMNASRRGVSCVLLADSVGSMGFFGSEHYRRLREAGVHVVELFAVGLFKTLMARADIRNHRKLICIDEQIGYTGSFNLADPMFFKQNSNVGQWIDVMLRITHQKDLGVVKAMGAVIATDMSAETDDEIYLLKKFVNNYRQKINFNPKIKNTQPNNKYHKDYPAIDDVKLQLLPSAPQLSGHLVYETIITALYNAKRTITITTPYFVPDEPLMLALLSAKRRGVDICIIMPKVNDSVLVKYASRAYFEPLLEAGITLALFEGGLLHSKIITIDKEYALFGTVNMDMRSFYLNMEVTLAIYANNNRELTMIDEIDLLQEEYLKDCEILTLAEWQNRKWYLRLTEGVVRLVSPLL